MRTSRFLRRRFWFTMANRTCCLSCLLHNLLVPLAVYTTLIVFFFFSVWLIWTTKTSWKAFYMDKSIWTHLLIIAYIWLNQTCCLSGVFSPPPSHAVSLCKHLWYKTDPTRNEQQAEDDVKIRTSNDVNLSPKARRQELLRIMCA